MEITVWESCLVKRVRNIQESLKIPVHPDNEEILTVEGLFKLVDNDVLELSKITMEEVEEKSNDEQESQPIVHCINWDLFKENKYEVYLLPKTNRSEEIRLRTKVSLTALRKGYIIKLIDISNRIPLIIEIDNVTECFDGDIRIEGMHLNKLHNGE